jgi:hypothetical protein
MTFTGNEVMKSASLLNGSIFMQTFKTFTESNQNNKGAFSEFPPHQQPNRIDVGVYDALASKVQDILKNNNFGETFVPSIKKSKALGKKDTGDIDVIVNPSNRNNWKNDLIQLFGTDVVARVSNGPQLMMVIKNLINDGKQYMIDFILANEGSFDFRSNYARFGTFIPVIVGTFARSLNYKFDQNGFYLRVPINNGFDNILLTKDFTKALQVLMLDLNPVVNDELFTPDQVIKWITDSTRFDSSLITSNQRDDGIKVVNKSSHRAAMKKPEIEDAYQKLKSFKKTATWDNSNYKIERQIFGDNYIDQLLQSTIKQPKLADTVTGKDVMDILHLPPGPEIGKILKHTASLTKADGIKYLQSLVKS